MLHDVDHFDAEELLREKKSLKEMKAFLSVLARKTMLMIYLSNDQEGLLVVPYGTVIFL